MTWTKKINVEKYRDKDPVKFYLGKKTKIVKS